MNSSRLPILEHYEPESLSELLTLKKELGPHGVILAGGTDLVPLLKRRTIPARKVISMRKIEELLAVASTGESGLRVGPRVTLRRIRDNPAISRPYPLLAHAASVVASNQIRNMATLVGNVCLDNKCEFFNQSSFWWKSRLDCFKRGGDICYVAKGGDRCYALSTADTVCALIALGARLEIRSVGSQRQVAVEDFYTGDGRAPLALAEDEVVTAVVLPSVSDGWKGAFLKKSARGSIDFATATLCIRLKIKEREIADAIVVLNSVSTKPVRAARTEDFLRGRRPDAETFSQACQVLPTDVRPLSPVGAPALVRRRTVQAMFADAMESIR